MHYCTREDIGKAIPELTLVQLSNDDSAAEQPNESVIEDAVRQAEELVDAHLRGRYVLPLETVPTVLRDAVVTLARQWLYGRRPEGAFPEAVKDSGKAAIKLLESIRDGKVTLGLPSGQAAPEPGEIRVRARRKQFDDDRWKDY